MIDFFKEQFKHANKKENAADVYKTVDNAMFLRSLWLIKKINVVRSQRRYRKTLRPRPPPLKTNGKHPLTIELTLQSALALSQITLNSI